MFAPVEVDARGWEVRFAEGVYVRLIRKGVDVGKEKAFDDQDAVCVG